MCAINKCVILGLLFAPLAYSQSLEDARTLSEQGDYRSAFEIRLKLAEAGDAEAQYSLAITYLFGLGTVQSDIASAHWAEKAALQGHTPAQVWVGDLYLDGPEIIRDQKKAKNWFCEAAKTQRSDALAKCAVMHDLGWGTLENDLRASELYYAAAIQGNPRAQFALGAYYANGTVVQKDYVQSYAWLNISASEGFKGAQDLKSVVEKSMSSQDVARAQQLSVEWTEHDYQGAQLLKK